MTDAIKTGTILIEGHAGARRRAARERDLFEWLDICQKPQSPQSPRARDGDPKAAWTFFYMAGEIKRTVFGGKQIVVRRAVQRIIAAVKSENCNCLQITQVALKSFLGVPYDFSAHSRHIQRKPVFLWPTTLQNTTVPKARS